MFLSFSSIQFKLFTAHVAWPAQPAHNAQSNDRITCSTTIIPKEVSIILEEVSLSSLSQSLLAIQTD